MRRKILSVVLSLTIVFGGVVLPDGINLLNIGNSSVQAADQASAELWEYELLEYGGENGISLTRYKGSGTDISIPAKIVIDDNSYSVLKLGDDIFKNNETINSVTLADTIQIIGDYAFSNATNLTCVVNSEGLKTIGNSSFLGCSQFNSIVLYDGITTIGNDAFSGCDNLTVYCSEYSSGYTYCNQNNIQYKLLNDPSSEPETIVYDNITYYLKNGIATLVSGSEDLSDTVVIPNEIEGLPVTNIQPRAFKDNKTITEVVLPSTMKSIEEYAFSGCIKLSKINFPDSVTRITEQAFEKTSLKSVVLPDSVYYIGTRAFADCRSLSRVVLPQEANVFGAQAFWGCSSLTEIDIPYGIDTLSYQSFAYCYSLKKVTIPVTVISIKNDAFESCRITDIYYEGSKSQWNSIEGSALNVSTNYEVHCAVPTPVTGISINKESITLMVGETNKLTATTIPKDADNTDVNWTSSNHEIATVSNGEITAISVGECDITVYSDDGDYFAICHVTVIPPGGTIGDNITWKIEDGVLTMTGEGALPNNASTKWNLYASTITDVVVSEGITEIGSYAFYNFAKLNNVNIANTVTSLGAYAFSGCSSLQEIVFPNGLTQIGPYAFSRCNALKTINLPAGIEEISSRLFYNCASLDNIVIPSNVNIIREYAFSGCTSLNTINIADSVTSIENGAFSNCTSLTGIDLPNKITSIGDFAFQDCGMLDSMYIPKAVDSIGTAVFLNCSNLNSIVIDNENAYYTIINGVLYNKDISIIYYYPDTKTDKIFEIPDTVRTISDYTFGNNNSLEELVIPEGVTELESIFYDQTALKKITIPSTAQNVYCISRQYTPELTDIYYNGTQSQWKQICRNIDEYLPDYVTVHYTVANVEGFTLDSTEISLDKGETRKLKGIFTPEYPSNTNINWSSSNGSIATVDKKGIVTAVNAGEAVISAVTEDGGFESVCKVIVSNDFAKIANETSGGVTWSIDASGLLTISGVSMSDFNSSSYSGGQDAPWKRYSARIKRVIIEPGLTYIGRGAFYNCASITEINIPESVRRIGINAFGNCTSLKSLYLSDNVTSIGNYAFYGCSSIEEIRMPETITSYGDMLYNGCSKLKSIVIPKGATKLGGFFGCSELENVTIPDSVTEWEYQSFEYCTKLNYINIGPNVTKIGRCFAAGFKKLNIPGNVKEIPYNAFASCANLTEVIVGNGVQVIGERAFANTPLKKIVIPRSVTDIDAAAFYNDPDVYLYVYNNSYAHEYAKNNYLKYIILSETQNPEISYGTGIAGMVTYTDGTAAANTDVSILYDDGTVKQSVKTDDEGKYEFTYAEVGQYTIKVTDASGNTGSELISVKRINAFDVFLTGTTDITLKKGWTISGNVSPADAKITITDQNGNVIAETTAENGSYSIPNIPNGEYIIKAETDDGNAVKEINVFDGDLEVDDITIEKAAPVEVSGTVYAQSRQGENYTKTWAQVIIYNTNGTTVASTRTDENGLYNFGKLPSGEYYLVAETMELREDKAPLRFFERPYALRGYTYINVTDTKINGDTDIVMLEQSDKTVRFEGSVRTTEGRYMACDLTLYDIFKNELDKLSITNGRFYATIPEGIYRISAVTADGRTGYTTIGLFKGKPQGSANIIVSRSQKITEHENILNSIPECKTYAEANQYRDTIISEKKFYDSLSRIEKNELSREYVSKLSRLVELLSSYQYYWGWGSIRIFSVSDGNDSSEITGTLENGGLIVSAEELEQNKEITLSVSAKEIAPTEIDESGISTGEEYVQLAIEDAAGDMKIGPYYDISLVKTVGENEQTISDISKNTDTTGKLKITIPISEEYEGHAQYKLIHVHNGETTTLADLDDDEDTITVETDKFSTFVLAYSDEKAISNAEPETFTVTLNTNGGNIADGENITGYTEGEEKALPTPTKEGYIFDGWYTDNTTFENKIDKITATTTGNLELYAKWTAVDYTISKEAASGGSMTVKETANINEIVTITVNPDTGYELTSLTVTGDGVDYSIGNGLTKTSDTTYTFTMPAKNVTVTAVFSKIKYDVTFKVEGVDTVVEVEHGDTAASKAPQSPTKTGNYHFVGWVKGTDIEQQIVTVWDAITEDGVVYTAKFEENAPDKYTVTFIAGEGGTLLGAASTEITKGESLVDGQIPTVSKTGYDFAGWNDGNKTYTTEELLNEVFDTDTTLTAQYTIKQFTVTFDKNGADSEDVASQTVDYSEKAEKPANPTKDGYTFTGWTLDGNSFSFDTPITEDIELVASWAEIEAPKTALELLSGFVDWMQIDMADGTDSLIFTASKKDNTAFTETDKFAVYVAEYTENGVLESVNKVDFTAGEDNTLTAVIATPHSDNYKIFIWTDKYEPVIKPITTSSLFQTLDSLTYDNE